ncbi:MAG: ATP-binding cassette domain-containing protein [Spirochaetaceae bacterium]|nr:ATP-binding cassette domain-containing protein [Spirochaetaceae bacterium]
MNYCVTARNISQFFSHKTALDAVTLQFQTHKIQMLLGENGAGKTTLASILSGRKIPSQGFITINNELQNFSSCKDAQKKGIVLVPQHPQIIKELNLIDNIALGSEVKNKLGFINRPIEIHLIQKLQRDWDISLDLQNKTHNLTLSEIFYVNLLNALLKKPKILILDEPTSCLSKEERSRFYKQIQKHCTEEMGFIIITHNLEESLQFGNSIAILKKGKVQEVIDNPQKNLSMQKLQQKIFSSQQTSPSFTQKNTKKKHESALLHPLYQVKNLSVTQEGFSRLQNISFSVYPEKITTIFGQQESGLETLEEVLSGIEPIAYQGEIFYKNQKIPQNAIHFLRDHRIALVPSNKRYRASHPSITIEQLLSLYGKKNYDKNTPLHIISEENMPITLQEPVSHLSGGMLQKLILRREFSRKPQLLLLFNPLYGLDYHSSEKICNYLKTLTDSGTGILIVSTEISLLNNYSDYMFTLDSGLLIQAQGFF